MAETLQEVWLLSLMVKRGDLLQNFKMKVAAKILALLDTQFTKVEIIHLKPFYIQDHESDLLVNPLVHMKCLERISMNREEDNRLYTQCRDAGH